MSPSQLRVIDISTLVAGKPAFRVAGEIGNTCRQQGFFYIVGHGVDVELQQQLYPQSIGGLLRIRSNEYQSIIPPTGTDINRNGVGSGTAFTARSDH